MSAVSVDWLLVGTGDIVRKRVAAALGAVPRSRIVAVCGRDQDATRAFAYEFGITTAYHDLDEALASSGANAVYIATPVDLHVPQSIAALEAGKNVLTEKPLGLDSQQCALAVAKARERGLIAGCAYYRRCSPRYVHANQMIAAEEFGEIVFVRLGYATWFNPAKQGPKYWRVVKSRSGGGPLADMGSHMSDVLIGLLGMPKKLYAKVESLVQPYEVEDSALVLMELRNGAQAVASFHWNSKTWSHEFEIVGTEARLKWSPFDSGKVIKTVGSQVLELDLPQAENPHLPLVEDFVQAVLNNRPPVVQIAEAAKATALLDAIYQSAETGRELAL